VENTKPLISPDLRAAAAKYPYFISEARKRIIFILCVFGISTFAGFIFYETIIKFVIDILLLQGVNIVFTSPFQFINLAISCGFTSGVVFSFPFIVAQILSFLRPALRGREYKAILWFLPFSLFLFLVGFLFGFLIMKWQIQIFLARSISLGIGNILDISRLLSVVILTSAFMGLGFQFPIVLLLLMRFGVIKHEKLSKARLWIYLGSFIFSILLPPDSILADILLALPLVILFEVTLILNRIFERRKVSAHMGL